MGNLALCAELALENQMSLELHMDSNSHFEASLLKKNGRIPVLARDIGTAVVYGMLSIGLWQPE